MDFELSENEEIILNEIHLKIDQTKSLFDIFSFLSFGKEFSENFNLFMRIEYFTLLKINQAEFSKKFHENKKIVKDYLLNRIQNSKNDYQSARYNHLIFYITHDSNYANKAIDLYFLQFINFVNGKFFNITDLDFKLVFYLICELIDITKHKEIEFKKFIHDSIENQSNINNRIKTKLIHFILNEELKDHVKHNIPVNQKTIKKLFSSELVFIPKICYEIAQNETIYDHIENNLQLGLKALQITQDNEMKKKIYELLGDNEYTKVLDPSKDPDNIIIPHQNSTSYRKMIEYYKNSGHTIKLNNALKDYDINKNICRYIDVKIPVNSDINSEFKKLKIEKYKYLISLPTKQIILHLIFGERLFFIYNSSLEHIASLNDKYLYNIFFQHIISDINNNESKRSSFEIQKMEIYINALKGTIELVNDIFLTCTKNKKITYFKLKNFFYRNTFFRQVLKRSHYHDEFSYTWFSTIDIGLKSFFDQYNLLLKNKQPDWRFTIDFLTLKFEGILRDILMLLGDSTTKLKDGNTSEILLDNLLRNEKLKSCFNQDDLNLFIYTFTNKGLNIRNNVAHSFYKPKDYTVDIAIVVLLCILRLAKFKIGLNSKQITP